MNEENLTPAIHEFSENKVEGRGMIKRVLIIALVVALGTLSGYFLSSLSAKNGLLTAPGKMIKTDTIIGSTDTKTFRDKAEGVLKKGGIGGEGTHKLERPGGVNQTVYLTSSVIDLDQFIGKKVRVWGETFKGDKAGWLMDVGKVELL